jgi:multicomponent Na+:H+ antiporter subunit E
VKIPGWLIYLLAMLPLWVVASGRLHVVQLGWGLVVGAATLPLSWRLFDLGRSYPARPLVHAIVGTARTFVVLFVPDAIRSSLDMARRIVQPVVPMEPGIVAVPLRFLGPTDELIVSNHITLTPGQLLIEVDHERGMIFIHSIDASDPERIRQEAIELHRQTLRRLYR